MAKPLLYMVSVQWGGGPHYFMGNGAASLSVAVKQARSLKKRSMETWQRHKKARPSVYVWKMQTETVLDSEQ